MISIDNQQVLLCLSYAHHTYNNLNTQPKGTVIVLVIPTTLTIVNKQQKGPAIVLVIPTTLTIILRNNQNILLLS
jgi:ethanolamine transporter EutH